MKAMKRIAAALVAGILVLSMAACEREPVSTGGPQHDATKTNVYVMNFDGGLGQEWLDAAELRFEEMYKDIELAEGQKGINIVIESKAQNGDKVLTGIAGAKYNVYFTEYVNYNQFVNKGVVMDITDILTEDLSAYGESQSIVDKMNGNLSSFLNVGTEEEPKYYAAPFYEAYSGIMYDVDLFEQKGFFFNTEGQFITGYFDDNHVYQGNDQLSYGPDGKTGIIDGVDYSHDDGLPATYDQFFQLCDYMLGAGVTPLIWPGANQDYINELILNMWADYEGVDRMMLNYTFDGVDDSIVESVRDDGTVVLKDPQTITSANGYLTYGQAGKYYALRFVERILQGGSAGAYTVSNIMSSGLTHTDCDTNFLKGTLDTKYETIGMMVNGTWFENEATEAFKTLSNLYGSATTKENRRIGIMPYPKATEEQVGEVVTPLCMKSAFCFVNANIQDEAVEKASKLFLQFVMTDDSLKEFQRIVGMPWALNYEMTEEDLAKCTYYSQSLYRIHSQDSVVYPYADNNIYTNNTSVFFSNKKLLETKLENGSIHDIPTTAFFDKGITAKEYFEGITRMMSENEWNTKFGSYINGN